jgi:hippurate hydrolase
VLLLAALLAVDVATVARQELSSLVELYRQLHRQPELSGQERATAARMAEEMSKAGYQVEQGLGGYGVVGLLRNGAGPTVLIRTDLDALPVEEKTGLPYASRNPGVMHACGHDLHMTAFAGAARVLSQLKGQWKGTLLLVGQPAEETVSGAAGMLAAGLYQKFPRPDYCLALHVDAALEAGKIGYREGYMLANVDAVDITIRGLGGHGAYPHLTKDPIVLAAQVVLALQTIVSREVKPIEPAVVTVGRIQGGTRRNIIPDEVNLELTVRTYSEETRRQVLAAIERITKGAASAAGLPTERAPIIRVRDDGRSPATYNDPALVRRSIAAIRSALGADRVVEREPEMAAEDFGLFGKVEPPIPSFMFSVGTIDARRWAEAQKPGSSGLPSLHSSQFWPQPELSISTGVQAMVATALELLAPATP